MSDASDSKRALWRITTQWSRIHDPSHFVLHYADAVRRFLRGALRDSHLADDVLQELLTQVAERGFRNADPARGRFRDYLIRIIRNAAKRALQRRAAQDQQLSAEQLDQLAISGTAALDQAWLDEWRQCLLDRALRALHTHEVETPGNVYFSLIKLAGSHPDVEQAELAARFNQERGLALSYDAFRKQLSRARRALAECLLREVARTLNAPSASDVEEELAAIGLLNRVNPFLPADWRTNPKLIAGK